MREVAELPSANQEIINLGNDKGEITILNLAHKMFDLFDYHPSIDTLPAPEGSVQRRCADITKARRLLGYNPAVDLDTGLRRTYEWYSRRMAR